MYLWNASVCLFIRAPVPDLFIQNIPVDKFCSSCEVTATFTGRALLFLCALWNEHCFSHCM